MNKEIKFKRDTSFRKQFFVPDSFAHPAKMDAQLLIWIVENYTSVGETILDPMAGSGTTMLACGLGRNCILVELEEKFCKMMRDNWEQVRMRPQLGYSMGDCQIIQGDARQLEGLLVDKIVTSPPFAGNKGGLRSAEGFKYGDDELGKRMMGGIKGGTGSHPRNIDNLPYGSIDKVITSPPYGNRLSDDEVDDGDPQRMSYRQSLGKVDAVISSPPYEGSVSAEKSGIDWSKGTDGGRPRDKSKEPAFNNYPGMGVPFTYGQNEANIGNLKGSTYLSAMLEVYNQCHKVLKPNGLMILVTKNFIRNKKVIRLDEDTIKLCEQAGFKFLEQHYRKLPALSFWRTIYYQKHPEVEQINHEDVLVFEKI